MNTGSSYPARRSFPAEVRSLRLLAEWVRETAAGHGITAARLQDLELCVDELATNVVRHGAAKGAREIAVTIDGSPDGVRVLIEDDGPAFDPMAVGHPSPPRSLAGAPLGGRGLPIVRSLADELRYERLEGRNRLELLFRSGRPETK